MFCPVCAVIFLCMFSLKLRKIVHMYKVDGHADLKVNFESSKVLCILDDFRQLLDHPKKLTDLTSQKHICASGCILSCSDVSVILFAFMCNFSICLFSSLVKLSSKSNISMFLNISYLVFL
jgi:hypothetical protein